VNSDWIKYLCCPIDRYNPLELLVLKNNSGAEVEEGILLCPECGRWFAVCEGIPHLVRDGLRLVEKELAFLEYYKDDIPENILNGLPFGIDGIYRKKTGD
jgi:uncharacterized protein YbaR (Trm112 family)